MRRALPLAALLVLGATPDTVAHDLAFTDVRLVLDTRGGFQAELGCDLDALALGVDASSDSAALASEIQGLSTIERERLVQGLVELLQRRVRLRFDGTPAAFEVSLPEAGRPEAPGVTPTALGLLARLSGQVPAGSREVSFFASRAFPPVRLTVRNERSGTTAAELLPRGVESQPVSLVGPAPRSTPSAAWRFLRLGFAHILPFGFDHVLFVAGLVLFSSRFKPLLAQISAFTAAHTLTLALSSQGFVQLPSRLVETLIGLSILYVGVENLARTAPHWTRLLLVFGFGLVHGLGFASGLRELGWPEGQRLLALLAFNLGVELGQLAVVGLGLAGLGLADRWGLNRRRLGLVASLGVAAVGLCLAALRGFGS